jgi:hypothetical protein
MGQSGEVICLNFMIGQRGSDAIQMQKVAFSGFGPGIWASFFFEPSRMMSTKRDRLHVSPDCNTTISTIRVVVKDTENMTFSESISCLGRVGRLTSAPTHIADLGFSKYI